MDDIHVAEQKLHSEISQLKTKFNSILDSTIDPNKKDLYELEKSLLKNLLELGNGFMQLHFDSLDTGDQGSEIVNNKNEVLKRCRERKKNI